VNIGITTCGVLGYVLRRFRHYFSCTFTPHLPGLSCSGWSTIFWYILTARAIRVCKALTVLINYDKNWGKTGRLEGYHEPIFQNLLVDLYGTWKYLKGKRWKRSVNYVKEGSVSFLISVWSCYRPYTNSVNYEITCDNLRHIAQDKRQRLSLFLVVSSQVSGLFCLWLETWVDCAVKL